MSGQDGVKASAMCYWRTTYTSEIRLMYDLQLIITKDVLRRQLCHVFPVIDALLHADPSSVAAD